MGQIRTALGDEARVGSTESPGRRKLLAWWEGYDLPQEKHEAKPEPAVEPTATNTGKSPLTGSHLPIRQAALVGDSHSGGRKAVG